MYRRAECVSSHQGLNASYATELGVGASNVLRLLSLVTFSQSVTRSLIRTGTLFGSSLNRKCYMYVP